MRDVYLLEAMPVLLGQRDPDETVANVIGIFETRDDAELAAAHDAKEFLGVSLACGPSMMEQWHEMESSPGTTAVEVLGRRRYEISRWKLGQVR